VSEATAIPAVEGWFTVGDDPHLIGGRCTACGTYVFPPRPTGCPNPACPNDDLEQVPLSTSGTAWSYTENRYAAPPPFVAAEPFEPYALAAVELAAEGLVVLGKVRTGIFAADLCVGMAMRVGIESLFRDADGVDHLVWVWEPLS
jgi:uncharacterized OB-fold protein